MEAFTILDPSRWVFPWVNSRTDFDSTSARALAYNATMADINPARKTELTAILTRMFDHADSAYSMMQFGEWPMGDSCPRFLKHAMLMKEYAKICSDALERGIDFAIVDELPVLPYRAEYLFTKLVVMYGHDTLRAMCVRWLAKLDGAEP